MIELIIGAVIGWIIRGLVQYLSDHMKKRLNTKSLNSSNSSKIDEKR